MATQTSWTAEQNKNFEMALDVYDKDSIPDRWEKIAEMVDGKNAEDVKKHYDDLVQDVEKIEQGRVSLPKYKDDEEDDAENDDDDTENKEEEQMGENANA